MRKLWCIPALLASLPLAAQAQGTPQKRIVIEVGNPDFRPYPIAVTAVRELGTSGPKVADTITEALRFDFDLPQMFKLLDPKSFLADPSKEGMTAAAIKFSDWSSVGADGLVKATSTIQGSSLKVEFHFFEVGSAKESVKKSYEGTTEQARKFAHKFADEVVLYLTGQRGPFVSQIAAVKKTKTGRELVVMDMDGKNRKSVTENGSINLLPAWSRNGRELLFTSYIRHNPNVYAIGVSGGTPKLLSGERGLNTGAVMSPDGHKVALTLSRDGNSEIYTMNADGTGLKRLTDEWAIDTSPSWSPDGKQIAFVSSRWGDPHIFVMNADGSSPKRLTDRGNYNQTPDWSPRGDLIAFTARDERAVFDIFTINPSTKEIRRLTQNQGNNEEPSFSPDGSLIAFTSTREGTQQLWVMAADGSHQHRLTKAGGYSTPAWGPFGE
ncbi:MAG: Tol-Pal system beta propeller repeat protein TolB [Myxococcota bacterium]